MDALCVKTLKSVIEYACDCFMQEKAKNPNADPKDLRIIAGEKTCALVHQLKGTAATPAQVELLSACYTLTRHSLRSGESFNVFFQNMALAPEWARR